MNYLELLQKLNFFHVKVAVFLSFLLTVGLGAGLGGLALGWKGAVGLPLILFGTIFLTVHGTLRLLFAKGMLAYSQGNHDLAAKLLWVAEVRQLRRYDPQGKAADAFRDSRTQVAGRMLRNIAQGMLGIR